MAGKNWEQDSEYVQWHLFICSYLVSCSVRSVFWEALVMTFCVGFSLLFAIGTCVTIIPLTVFVVFLLSGARCCSPISPAGFAWTL